MMESQRAATASSLPPSGRQRPVLAAVQPSVEASSEPLLSDDYYRLVYNSPGAWAHQVTSAGHAIQSHATCI
jgi:hypothetical protein